MMVYWWIERANGKLVTLGRRRDGERIWDSGCPNPMLRKKQVEPLVRHFSGEKAVQVKIEKI